MIADSKQNRRVARERREYLHARVQQLQEAKLAERRALLKRSLEQDKELPASVRDDTKLQQDYKWDVSATDAVGGDDEYYALGTREPKVLITTSRDPSSRLNQFAKEMRLVVPNAHRINRGNYVINDIVAACRANDVTDLVLLHEHRGQPDALVISHFPHGPTVSFSLHNVILRHDIPNAGTTSGAYPHLIFENLTSRLGRRTQKVLSALFPPSPKAASPRVVTFANDQDFISFRNHMYVKTGPKSVELAEVGPRFEMRLFEMRLGTAENTNADVEWRLKNLERHKRGVMAATA